MRLVNIDNVEPQMTLGESIHGVGGQILLHRGVKLTPRYIEHLRCLGYPALYIDDDDTSDVAIPQAVSPETRSRVLRNLTDAFDAVSRATDSFRASSKTVALEHVQSQRFAKAVQTLERDERLSQIVGDVDTLLDQLMNRDVLAGLNSIKTHDNYTFQHSIDVTIMGMVLARRAGWDIERQRAFGIGCILHDIGKIFIDPAILNKPGQLTDEEFALVKTHPSVGYDLIKAIAPRLGVLVPQVALQHHEREDGRGYPRGLKGDNTLGQNKPGLIHEFGSLCAVADVYDALTSDRSYRRGWPTDRTVNYIVESARTQFNLEAVQIFAKVAAPFPVCSEVRVRNGKYAGHIGIVSDVSEAEINRPKVRLMFNQFGGRIDPLEVDLRIEQDVNVDCVDRAEPSRRTLKRAG